MNHGIRRPLRPVPARLQRQPVSLLPSPARGGPVHESPLGFWVLTRYEDCVMVLRDQRFGRAGFEGLPRGPVRTPQRAGPPASLHALPGPARSHAPTRHSSAAPSRRAWSRACARASSRSWTRSSTGSRMRAPWRSSVTSPIPCRSRSSPRCSASPPGPRVDQAVVSGHRAEPRRHRPPDGSQTSSSAAGSRGGRSVTISARSCRSAASTRAPISSAC